MNTTPNSEINIAEEYRRLALPLAKSKLSRQYLKRIFYETSQSDRRSRDVLDNIFLKQKIIHDIAPSTQITLLGQSLQTPIMVAPMAMMATVFTHGISMMCASTQSAGSITWIASTPRERYQEFEETNPLIYIEKPLANRENLQKKLTMAEHGCVAVGIDVDSGGRQLGQRDTSLRVKPMTVNELQTIRQQLRKPFIVKGVLSVDDALNAVESGADVIVVSNHYGVTLDYAQAPLEVLPKIVKVVPPSVVVLVDGQIRSGSDVFKALALGAKGVLIGRPIIWAALVAGTEGIVDILDLMTTQLCRTMLYTGTRRINDVSIDQLVLPPTIFNIR